MNQSGIAIAPSGSVLGIIINNMLCSAQIYFFTYCVCTSHFHFTHGTIADLWEFDKQVTASFSQTNFLNLINITSHLQACRPQVARTRSRLFRWAHRPLTCFLVLRSPRRLPRRRRRSIMLCMIRRLIPSQELRCRTCRVK